MSKLARSDGDGRPRLFPQHTPLRVRFKGHTLPLDATAAGAGVQPMDYLEAFYEDQS